MSLYYPWLAHKHGMQTKRTSIILLVALIPLSFILTQCFTKDKKDDARGQVFAGSASCVKCHQKIYDSYLQTAHYQSSRPALEQSIHGSFAHGANVYEYGNGLSVVMKKGKDGLYQVGYNHGKQTQAEKFGITIGGVKAETYLYWKGNQLFELPMSYFAALKSWTNSPGYDTSRIDFTRPILRRCMECHSSYIKEIPQQQIDMAHRLVEFDKASLIYGIDCERCHGPAANHVNYHTEYPEEKKAKYITTYKTLTRAQKLDACAVCHSGNKGVFQTSAFVFKQGDTLAKFKEADFLHQTTDPKTLDVHGNQNSLLAASKCFMMSNMDCNTCHNVHKNESDNLLAYSQKCMQCHSEANHNFCKMGTALGVTIKSNCIDCHMPLKPSNVISVAASGGKKEIPYLVRTHRIAIYPEESKKIMAFMKTQKVN
jgi:predicted CXXCH cytochrome family protein